MFHKECAHSLAAIFMLLNYVKYAAEALVMNRVQVITKIMSWKIEVNAQKLATGYVERDFLRSQLTLELPECDNFCNVLQVFWRFSKSKMACKMALTILLS
jgi:hypothetical protein